MPNFKNHSKNSNLIILINYLKINKLFFIFNIFYEYKQKQNKSSLKYKINNFIKNKLLLSVKQSLFFGCIKNSIVFLIFKNNKFLFKNINQLNSLNIYNINLNTKLYKFNVINFLSSFTYLQNKELLFKNFMFYLKKNNDFKNL